MKIQCRYDPVEDRMLLSVEHEAESGTQTRQLWFTRRQWLALFHQVVALKAAPLDAPNPKAPPRGRAQPLAPQPDAVPVRKLGVRAGANGAARLMFGIAEDDNVGFAMNRESLADFQRMLEQQAERAGWDPRPALKRLDAMVAAARAMKKAQGDKK